MLTPEFDPELIRRIEDWKKLDAQKSRRLLPNLPFSWDRTLKNAGTVIVASFSLISCEPAGTPPPTTERAPNPFSLPVMPEPTETPVPAPKDAPPSVPPAKIPTFSAEPSHLPLKDKPPVKEAEQPVYIWFVGSSTIQKIKDKLTDYLHKIFPAPLYNVSIDGRSGYETENLTDEIKQHKLFPSDGINPINPELIDYIVVYGGANDLYANDTIQNMTNETVDLFASLALRYPQAKFVYIKPYHLTGTDAVKNPAINAFNKMFSVDQIAEKVRQKTGRTITIAVVDVNNDIDNCDPSLQCYEDTRHAGPPMMKNVLDLVKAEIEKK